MEEKPNRVTSESLTRHIAVLGLLVASLSLGVSIVQAYNAWITRNRSLESDLYGSQLAACSQLITNYQKFSNTQAQWRFGIALRDGTEATSIKNLEPKQIAPDKQKFDKLIDDEIKKVDELGADAHVYGYSVVHFFEKQDRQLIHNMQQMIVTLSITPEGNENARPEMFNALLGTLMKRCTNLADQYKLTSAEDYNTR